MKRLLLALPFLVAACDGAAMLPTESTASTPSYAAGNGPARYQLTTTSYQVLVYDVYEHDFAVKTNPCDGSIAITGGTPLLSGYYTTETITGTLAGGVISFHSIYDGPFNPGGNYFWDGSFSAGGGPLSGSDINGQIFTGTVNRLVTTSTNYKNHGDFVSHNADKNDAAHSCIGMPITS